MKVEAWIALAALAFSVTTALFAWWRRRRGIKRGIHVELHPRARFHEDEIVYDVGVSIFNAHDQPIGIHGCRVDIRPSQVGVIAPMQEGLPETVEGQHSARGTIDGIALRRMWRIGGSKGEQLITRFEVQVGNKRRVKSEWTLIPPPHAASRGGPGGIPSRQ